MTVDASTAALFDRLPGYMQAGDDSQGDRPLLTLLSIGGAQQEPVRLLADRLDRRRLDPDADSPSDFSDPLLADDAWLPWLAGGVGVDLHAVAGPTARRAAVVAAPTGLLRTTKDAIATAARTVLTGTRYVRVYDHSAAEPGDGTVWDLLIVTRPSETADPDAVLEAIVTAHAKPSGATLHYREYAASYTQVQDATSPDTYAGRLSTFPAYSDVANYLPPGG